MENNRIKTYRDDFGNTASIEPLRMYPCNDAPRKTQAFRLWIESGHRNNYTLYHVSVYDTLEAAESALKSFSCGIFK